MILIFLSGDKPYKCKFCGKAFNRNAHLVRHRKIHNGGEKEWKCEQCGFSFWEKSDLVRHIKSHEGNRPFKCDFCEQTFVWKRYLYKHLKNNHRTLDRHFCPGCCQCFESETELQNHQAENHPQKKALTHTCDVCQEEFHFKYKLDEHMYQHTGRKAHECDKCSQKFVSRKELDRHKAEHSQEVSFSCNTCDKSFLSVEELQKHLRMHTGGGKFSCTVCGLTFRWRSQLTNHMVVHSTDHDYPCSICNKEFKRKRDLTRHVKIFHDTKPPYTCTECNLDFHSPINLHQHKSETHWKKQDELDNYYSCTKCSGLFKIKSDLEKHVLKVHPPRPYWCAFCNKRFTCLKWIEKHFELKHPGEIMIEGTTYEIRPHKEPMMAPQILEEAGFEIATNGVEEVKLDNEEMKEEVSNEIVLDHVYAEGTDVQETLIDGQNVVVVQTVDDQMIETSELQPHTPISEAITLAEFSQQATGNTVIPVFLQKNQTSDLDGGSNIELQQVNSGVQNVARLIAQPTKIESNPAIVTTKGPQIIKITRTTAQALMNQNAAVNVSSLPRPVKVLRTVKSIAPASPQLKVANAPQIKILPIGGNSSQQFVQLATMKQDEQVTVIHMPDKADGTETMEDEAMQTE